MPTIRDLAEEYWQGRADLAHHHHPVAPVEDRRAEEIDDGVLFLKSAASITAVDTGDGLVMLDTGAVFDRDLVYESVRAWRPSTRLIAAIFSHHHIDHIFGTARFEAEAEERTWAPPKVYGHKAMAEHLRRYERTRGWNAAINQRQFGGPWIGTTGRAGTASPTSPTTTG